MAKWLGIKCSSGGMAEIDNVVVVEAADKKAAHAAVCGLLKVDKFTSMHIHVTTFEELTPGWAYFT